MEDFDIKIPTAILTEDINRVKCPHCGRVLHIRLDMSGEKDCPYCNQRLMLPDMRGEELSDEDFIDLTCPHCGNTVSVDIDQNEHEVICPFCDEKIDY